MGKILYEELSGAIIGAAMDVLNELKPGLDEKLYERALAIELQRRGHKMDIQHSYPVFYRDQLIGNLIPDMIVDNTIIVDPKVVSTSNDTHIAQMMGYLAISSLERALLLNISSAHLEWKRVVRQIETEPDLPDLMPSKSYRRNPRF
jgi:GxxExxY protein